MPSPRPSAAGGILLALGAIAGTIVGLARGQVTIGFLAGLAAGTAAALAVWLMDRR